MNTSDPLEIPDPAIIDSSTLTSSSPAQMHEVVNIVFSGPYSILSNLARTPFTIDNVAFASVEAFVQAIKRPEGEKRDRIAQLDGYEAQRAGKNPNRVIRAAIAKSEVAHVYWKGESIPYGSETHKQLITRAIVEKFRSSPLV